MTGYQISEARQMVCRAFAMLSARSGEYLQWEANCFDQVASISSQLNEVDWSTMESSFENELLEGNDFLTLYPGGQCYTGPVREGYAAAMRAMGCSEALVELLCGESTDGIVLYGDAIASMVAAWGLGQHQTEALVAFILGHERCHFHDQDLLQVMEEEQALCQETGENTLLNQALHDSLPAEREANLAGFYYAIGLGYEAEARQLWPRLVAGMEVPA